MKIVKNNNNNYNYYNRVMKRREKTLMMNYYKVLIDQPSLIKQGKESNKVSLNKIKAIIKVSAYHQM